MTTSSPAVSTGDRLAADAETAIARLERVFAAQQAYRWEVARTTAAERREKLARLKRAIVDRADGLAAALLSDLRKARAEVELTELQPSLAEINHAIKHLGRWMRPRRVAGSVALAGTRSELRYEPKGVVLIMAPFNYPFGLLVNPLVAAIAAGNCVMIKPSEKAPATARFLGELVRDCFEEREVALFEGDAEVAKALLELPFDHIFFTGSTRLGRIVMGAAAKHLASVTLELGGKSPVVVDDSANVREAARRIVWGKFINAGQTCVAPDYVFVARSRTDEFLNEAKSAIDDFYGTNDTERAASKDLCRLVDEAAFHRVQGLVDDAVERGATVVAGGQSDASTLYIAPTILTNVPDQSSLMREEIFGPVLPVKSFDSLDDALAYIRARPKPLALYVFSSLKSRIEKVLRGTTAGGTAVNNTVIHLANPNLPFGGVGESGVGSYHGEFGFRTFSHERAVLRQGRMSLMHLFYPPYSDRVRKRVAAFTKWLS